MSRLNPSVDHISSPDTSPTDTVGGPTAADKYDNSRHLKYGQTEQKESDESIFSYQQVRRYSASSDTKPVLIHTFHEEFTGGINGDDIIKKEEEKEKQRKKKEQEKRKKSM